MSRSQFLYAKVARRVHGDRKYRHLSRNARFAWLTLLTSEHQQSSLPGLWRAGEAVILEELVDFTPAEWHDARAELEDAGMLLVDDDERLVWLVNAVRSEYNTPDNPNIARFWARSLAMYDLSPIVKKYVSALLIEAETWPRGVVEAFCETLKANGIDTASLETVDETQTEPLATCSPIQGTATATASASATASSGSESQLELTPAAPRRAPSPVKAVFEHWCRIMGHERAVLDSDRQRVIEKALKLRPADELKRAIDGCHASAWHMGENDRGKVYDSLSLILRNAEKIEHFIGCLSNPSGASASGDSDLYRFDNE